MPLVVSTLRIKYRKTEITQYYTVGKQYTNKKEKNVFMHVQHLKQVDLYK